MNNCKCLTETGMCKKWSHPKPCKPSTIEWCDEPVEMINPDQMCGYSSIFGNTFSYITPEQIDELMNGKVVAIDDNEYSHFICLKK